MTWIKKTRGWIEPKAARATPAVPAQPSPGEQLLVSLLADDLKGKQNFNAWEVATTMGVTKRTVERYVDSGRLKGIRLPGKHIRITRAAWIEFLLQYNPQTPPA